MPKRQSLTALQTHNLESYFESLAEQGFQNNHFSVLAQSSGVSAPSGSTNLPSRAQAAIVAADSVSVLMVYSTHRYGVHCLSPRSRSMAYDPLKALDLARAGKWDEAHEQVQPHSDRESCLIHAYLHRVEGDLSNARY